MDPKKIDVREAPPPGPSMFQEVHEKFQNNNFLPGEKDIFSFRSSKIKSKKSRYNKKSKKSKINKRRRSRSRRYHSGGKKEESGTVSVATTAVAATDPPRPPGGPPDDIPGKPIHTMSQLEMDEINKNELYKRDFPKRFENAVDDDIERIQLQHQANLAAMTPVVRAALQQQHDQEERDSELEELFERLRLMSPPDRHAVLEMISPRLRDAFEEWRDAFEELREQDERGGGASYPKGQIKRNNKSTKSRSRSRKRSRRRSRTRRNA
jgi:hypothetical protein